MRSQNPWRRHVPGVLLLGTALALVVDWFGASPPLAPAAEPAPERAAPALLAASTEALPGDGSDQRIAVVAPASAAVDPPGTVASLPGFVVRGRVVSARDGLPLAGAEVRYQGPGSLRIGDVLPDLVARTDAQGRFEWPQFPLLAAVVAAPDTLPLRVVAPGHLPSIARQGVRLDGEGATVDTVRLAPARRGEVLVVDEAGTGVAGARVHCAIVTKGSTVSVRAHAPDGTTDAQGRASFWLRDPGPGALGLWVEKDGWLPASATGIGTLVQLQLRRGLPATVDLVDVPAGASPEVRAHAAGLGLMFHALVPAGQSTLALPDLLGAGPVAVRAEVTGPSGHFTAAASLAMDHRRCTLRFTRAFAPLAVHGPADAMGGLTLGVYVRKFGQGPFSFRATRPVPAGQTAADVLPRIVGDVFVTGWSPRAGFLQAEAPCRHDDAAGLRLLPRPEETLECVAHLCGADGAPLPGGHVELLVGLPPHWTCQTGKPESMRVHAPVGADGGLRLGRLPRTHVEGLVVGASGRVLRIARTSIAPELRIFAVGP